MSMLPEHHESDWQSQDFAVIDVEGTGSSEDQRIIEIAAVKIRGGCIQPEVFHHLLNPGMKVSPIATRIHGIRGEDLVGMPTPHEIEDTLQQFCLGSILVAHNAHVEIRLLKNTFSKFPFRLSLDTLKLSKKLYPERRSHSLDALINEMKLIVPDWYISCKQRHRAQYDALMTALAFAAMIRERMTGKTSTETLLRLASVSVSEPLDESVSQNSSEQLDLF